MKPFSRRRLFFLVIVLFVLPFSIKYQKLYAENKQTLFLSIDQDGAPYRIPALAVCSDSTVLAVTDKRWCRRDIGFGHIDLVIRRSEDSGKTWTRQAVIADGSGIEKSFDMGYGDAAIAADRCSGEVLVMCATGYIPYWGERSNPLRTASVRSLDYGKTWSEPMDVTEAIYGLIPEAQGIFFSSGRILQSSEIKVGDYYRIYSVLTTRPGGNYLIYSDDFGRSWSVLGGKVCIPRGDEAKCEELEDGTLIVSSRKQHGRHFNTFTYTDIEKGEGIWGEPVASDEVEGGLSYGENATNGEVLYLWACQDCGRVHRKNMDCPYCGSSKAESLLLQSVPTGDNRTDLFLFVKRSGFIESPATGWKKLIEVSNTLAAYSTMELLPDGTVGVFYEEAPNDYCMVFKKLSIWLENGDIQAEIL